MGINQMLAIGLLALLCMALFRKWTFLILGVFLLLILIRFLADIYWYGRDRGKW